MKKAATSLLVSLVMAAGLWVFWSGLHGGFIFDDHPNLVEDADWKVVSLEPEQWARAIGAGIASGTGRPLAMFTFALNHYFTGMDPVALKLTGLLMHALNGGLVLLLCMRLLSLMPAREASERLGRYAAACVAIAWTVHPIQVSTALYVVQRMEVGAHTGVLLALLAYVAARGRQIEGRTSWPFWALGVLAWVLGLGFKESALLLPGYALVVEGLAFRFRSADRKAESMIKAVYLLGILAAAGVFVFKVVPWALRPETYAFRDFDLQERLLTQPAVLLTYLRDMLLPYPERLTFYYDNYPVASSLVSVDVMLGLGALAVVLLGAIQVRHRWPLVTCGVLFFFIAHALTSNVIPLELAFEHRNYFALLGVLVAVAQLMAWAVRPLSREIARTLGALAVLCLGLLGAMQAHAWGDPFRLAYTLASRNPDSPRAGYGLGVALLDRAGTNHDSPLVSLAIAEFEHAASIGTSPLADQGLIVALSRSGRDVPAATWERFRGKLRRHDAGVEDISALRGVLECRIRQLCHYDDQQLLDTVLVAVERNPGSPLVLVQYSNFAWNVAADPQLAITLMREAVRLDPRDLQYQVNLLRFLAAAGGHDVEAQELKAGLEAGDPHGAFRDQIPELGD